MKYIIIGGAGFIGSHLVDKLISEGCNVAIVDDLSGGFEKNVTTDEIVVYEFLSIHSNRSSSKIKSRDNVVLRARISDFRTICADPVPVKS